MCLIKTDGVQAIKSLKTGGLGGSSGVISALMLVSAQGRVIAVLWQENLKGFD